MNRQITIVSAVLFAAGVALAQGHPANFARPVEFPAKSAEPAKATDAPKRDAASCEAKAVGKDGKPLTGDAKAASMKKCAAEAKAAK